MFQQMLLYLHFQEYSQANTNIWK